MTWALEAQRVPADEWGVAADVWSALGTDGLGLSDTRDALRCSFLVDAPSIVVQVLARLAALGQVDCAVVVEAAARYRIDDPTSFPVGVSAGGDS